MAVKCGNGHVHETVAEVRACFGFGGSSSKQQYRSNKYAGTCVTCGITVPPEAGRIDRNANNKWVTFHLPGQCPQKTDAPAFQAPGIEQDFSQIPRGHYATKSISGNNDFDFWRVDRPEQGAYAGRTFVKRIVGGKPDLNVSKSTRIGALGAILREGIDVCGFRYGQELGKCRHCNRHLTDELSRSLSAGPECRRKH
jgi:hypothetical protein